MSGKRRGAVDREAARVPEDAGEIPHTDAPAEESQIQRIAGGSAVTRHRFNKRSQPMGQPPVTSSREAILRTTVPAPSEEEEQ